MTRRHPAARKGAADDVMAAREHLRMVCRHLIRATDNSQPGDPLIRVLGVVTDVALRLASGDPGGPPSQSEIYSAMDVLGATERYSVKDNETNDWIA